MSSSITDGVSFSQPVLVTVYSSTNVSQSIVHNVLGRAYPDVTLLPPALRTGTFVALFSTEVDAEALRQMLTQTTVFAFADSDTPSVSMTFILSGSVSKAQDGSNRAYWAVSVDYQEVQQ